MTKFTQLITGVSLALSLLLSGGSAMAFGKRVHVGKLGVKFEQGTKYTSPMQQSSKFHRVISKACKFGCIGGRLTQRNYRYYRHEFRQGGGYLRDFRTGRLGFRFGRDNYRNFDRGMRHGRRY